MNSTLQQTAEFRKMYPSDLDRVILIEREIFLFPWSLGNFSDSLKADYVSQALPQIGRKKVGVKNYSNILFNMPEKKMQNRYSWMYENLITVPHSSINKWVSSTLQRAKVIIRQCADVKMRLSCN